jgi:hypothetical protein
MGPWIRTADGRVFVYTNEHVVRSGTAENKTAIIAPDLEESEETLVGHVILASGGALHNKNDATMTSYNPKVAGMDDYRFVADWAIIESIQHSPQPIMKPISPEKGCGHVLQLAHLPMRGTVMATGAAHRRQMGKPWIARYAEDSALGIPTSISKGGNMGYSEERHCWQLGPALQREGRNYTEADWINSGIGIPGDSGTGVVDCETGKLCGLVIGQTSWKHPVTKEPHRRALIIDMEDVFRDTIKVAAEEVTMMGIALDKATPPNCSCL